MKKSIVFAAFTLLIAGAAVAQTEKPAQVKSATTTTTTTSTATDSKSTAEMTFDSEEYNFGTIKQGESVTHEFTFTNTGKDDIIITNAQATCGCTVPVWPKEPIKKGQKATIKATFNSAGKMGMQDKTVTITSNAKNSPRVLHIKGTIEAAAATPEQKGEPKN